MDAATDLESFRQRLAAIEDPEPEPELEPEPEPEIEPLESGRLVVEFSRSIVRRNDKGQITDIVSDVSHRVIRRNEHGAVIAVDEIIEREELD